MRPGGIRIGNQTHLHTPARAPYEFALAHHFDAFEWLSDKGRAGWSEDDSGPAERVRLREDSPRHDVRFSVHAPVAADPTTSSGRDAVLRSIRFAGDVGAAVVNLHFAPGAGARVYAESLRPLLEAARPHGVVLTLENTPETSPDVANAVFGVLTAVPGAAGRVGLCFDMGHANLFPATRNDYVRWLDAVGEHVPVLHWHAHENWGDRDSHLPLFTGPSSRGDGGLRGLVRRLLARGFAGSVILEQWPAPPELLVASRDRLRALIAEVVREFESLPGAAAPEGSPATV